MTVDNGRVCCNCDHCIREHDYIFGTVCHCEEDEHYIGYTKCMSDCCERWKPEERKYKWSGLMKIGLSTSTNTIIS